MNSSTTRNEVAPLIESGIGQARKLGGRLVEEYGFDVHQPVAVSEYMRTQQTASDAGFMEATPYPILNEVQSVALLDVRRYIESGELPAKVIKKAEAILSSPPEESIWFSHGFVIEGLRVALGLPSADRPISDYCGINKFEI